MRVLSLHFIYIALLFFGSHPVSANDEHGRAVTACIIDLPYWSHVKGDRSKGIYPDLYRALFKQMGIERYHIVALHYAKLINMIENGKCDMSATLVPANLRHIQLGHHYWTIQTGIVALAKNTAVNQQLQQHDLTGLSIGVLDKVRLGELLPDIDSMKTKSTRKIPEQMRLLASETVDAIAGDLDIIQVLAKAQGLALGPSWILEDLPLYFVMSKNSAYFHHFDEFNAQWQQLEVSGYLSERVLWHLAK
ncbi:MAG: transporter substrate-binding domain-containing protein [Pseudomonadales bacterium]|nr:transporter substrate-binding domain-containing protein [Pseudomonadales bacterium]